MRLSAHVTVLSRLVLVGAYEGAWRTFSWSEHLTLDLPPPYKVPYISAGPLRCLSVRSGEVRSSVVLSVPSRLREIPECHCCRINFDLALLFFNIDATQDSLAVVPRHNNTTLMPPFYPSCGYTHQLYHPADLCARCPLVSRTPSLQMGKSFFWKLPNTLQRGIANTRYATTFLGMITWSGDKLNDRLSIWNWKTGILLLNMVRALHNALSG